MKLLIIAATEREVESSRSRLSSNRNIQWLISGPGMMATAYHVGQALASRKPDLVVNAGVCGSFGEELKPEAVVNVVEETVADLGAEDGDNLQSVFDLDLQGLNQRPFTNGRLINPHHSPFASLEQLARVRGISVNSVSGRTDTIERLRVTHDPDVESMEGAAVFYACLMAGVPFLEVRAVSNYVEQRNRDAWKLDDAIRNLNEWLLTFIDEIHSRPVDRVLSQPETLKPET